MWSACHYFCHAALLPNDAKGSTLHDVCASRGENTIFWKEKVKANIENIWGGPPVSESVFITVIVQEVFLLANVGCPMQIAQAAAEKPSGSLWLRLTNRRPVHTPNTHCLCNVRKSHSARLSQHLLGVIKQQIRVIGCWQRLTSNATVVGKLPGRCSLLTKLVGLDSRRTAALLSGDLEQPGGK